MTVGGSVVAEWWSRRWLRVSSEYRTVTGTVPGKPVEQGGLLVRPAVHPSPAGDVYVSLTPTESGVCTGSAAQILVLKPLKPPWRVFGLLLMSSEYCVARDVER